MALAHYNILRMDHELAGTDRWGIRAAWDGRRENKEWSVT